MFKSGIFDCMVLPVQSPADRIILLGRQNEVSVFIDMGGTVWFFLYISHLSVFDAGHLSSGSV